MISEDRNGVSFGCLIPMSRVSVTTVASSSSSSLLHLHPQSQDALWQMNPRSREQMEPGSYPVCEDGPNCSYYIRTGLCRFGATCRFNHPPNWKLNEMECAYFMRNGHCKFGSICKFHHPQPSNTMVSLRGSSFTVAKPFKLYTYGCAQGVVSVPGWNLYTGQMGSVSPSENQRPTAGTSFADGASPQGEAVNAGSQFRLGTLQLGQYAFQRDNVFPERPGFFVMHMGCSRLD